MLKVNKICEVFLNLYFKNKHLKEGKYSFNFLLYNKEIKIIGNEGTIQIPYFEEKKNIVLSQNDYQNKSNIWMKNKFSLENQTIFYSILIILFYKFWK